MTKSDLSTESYTNRLQSFIKDDYFAKLFKKFGSEFIDYRQRWDRASSASHLDDCVGPIHIDLELSNSCNYRCSFCPYSVPKPQRPKGFNSDLSNIMMPMKLVTKALTESAALGARALELGYNTEPLLYPHLFEVIKLARNLGFVDIRMGTNGSLLEPKLSAKLIEAGLTQLQVSVDAIDEDTYKLSRNSMLYNKVVFNIKRFLDIRRSLASDLPLLRLTYVMTPQNRKNSDQFLEQWGDLADQVTLQDLFVYENVNEQNSGVSDAAPLTLHSNDINTDSNCYMPKVRLSIKSDGTVHPCCTVPGMSLKVGNLNEMSISDIWNSPSFMRIRSSHIDGTWKANKICSDCMSNAF
ncbi:MAG: hypothetical protein CMM03_03870 [Rhodopirellula sp.]|nr:hypothetical protein [Rhodopirellula sp.]